jgi:hypothetical protein
VRLIRRLDNSAKLRGGSFCLSMSEHRPECSGLLAKLRMRAIKLVAAIIKHFQLDEVCQALSTLNVSGMTIMEVKGYGRQKGPTENYQGAESTASFLPKIRLEVARRE